MQSQEHVEVAICIFTINDQIVEQFQSWGSYFLKVTRYLLLLPTTKNISLQSHIT